MPNFVSFAASIAELAHGEICVLIHSPNLFDAPGTKAQALGINSNKCLSKQVYVQDNAETPQIASFVVGPSPV